MLLSILLESCVMSPPRTMVELFGAETVLLSLRVAMVGTWLLATVVLEPATTLSMRWTMSSVTSFSLLMSGTTSNWSTTSLYSTLLVSPVSCRSVVRLLIDLRGHGDFLAAGDDGLLVVGGEDHRPADRLEAVGAFQRAEDDVEGFADGDDAADAAEARCPSRVASVVSGVRARNGRRRRAGAGASAGVYVRRGGDARELARVEVAQQAAAIGAQQVVEAQLAVLAQGQLADDRADDDLRGAHVEPVEDGVDLVARLLAAEDEDRVDARVGDELGAADRGDGRLGVHGLRVQLAGADVRAAAAAVEVPKEFVLELLLLLLLLNPVELVFVLLRVSVPVLLAGPRGVAAAVGAGFAERLHEDGQHVVGVDELQRPAHRHREGRVGVVFLQQVLDDGHVHRAGDDVDAVGAHVGGQGDAALDDGIAAERDRPVARGEVGGRGDGVVDGDLAAVVERGGWAGGRPTY